MEHDYIGEINIMNIFCYFCRVFKVVSEAEDQMDRFVKERDEIYQRRLSDVKSAGTEMDAKVFQGQTSMREVQAEMTRKLSESLVLSDSIEKGVLVLVDSASSLEKHLGTFGDGLRRELIQGLRLEGQRVLERHGGPHGNESGCNETTQGDVKEDLAKVAKMQVVEAEKHNRLWAALVGGCSALGVLTIASIIVFGRCAVDTASLNI